MGTNYYLSPQPPCPHCGREYEQLHIGKSSGGWCFSLHVDPDKGIKDLADWGQLWLKPGAVITDEYGETVPPNEMLSIITERKRDIQEETPYGYRSWADFHNRNGSEPGPKGLLRHRIGHSCIGHGAGTWDLIVGEFS